MTSDTISTITRPAPLACNECRRRHLRCDGGQPICQRCIDHARRPLCIYTPSRRGLGRRPTKARSTRNGVSSTHPGNAFGDSGVQILEPPTATVQHFSPNTAEQSPASQQDQRRQPAAVHHDHLQGPSSPVLGDEQLINAFYLNVWPAHPFLVPRRFYAQQQYPALLELVICDIGQHFSSSASANPMLHDLTMEALSGPEPDETTIHRVQALILTAILLHADHQPREADQCVQRATRISNHLEMHRSTYASDSAIPSDSITIESYRRTWWELYMLDAYLAGLHHRQRYLTAGFGSKDLPLLPSSEAQYESGQCERAPASIFAFEQRLFSSVPRDFSLHCYRIEAVRIIDRVLLVAAKNDARPDDIQAVDNALASWRYNLPSTNPDVVTPSGEVDQALFQAHCYIGCASIFLHFPRSDLPATVPSKAQIACAQDYPQLSPTSAQHTIKAIAASKELSNLAAIPWPLERHSPLFACALILACIVQLAAATIHLHQCRDQCIQHHRDRVVLIMGALRQLGTKWLVASNAAARLKPIAQRIFQHIHHDEIAPTPYDTSVVDSGMGMSDDLINVTWFDLFDPAQFENALALAQPT